MTRREVLLAIAVGALAGTTADGQSIAQGQGSGAREPGPTAQTDRWSGEIATFAADDAAKPFAKGGIVFVGSSSIRLWNTAEAFPGLPILNRGFGGTQIADSIRHVDRLVLRHAPRTVVFYAGDNDIAAGRSAQQVLDDFRTFVGKVHGALPRTRIAFVAVKPSLARWAKVDIVREANRLVRAFCDADDRLGFVDVDGPMIGWDGKPRPDLFVEDGLHLSSKGYALWNVLVTPFLE